MPFTSASLVNVDLVEAQDDRGDKIVIKCACRFCYCEYTATDAVDALEWAAHHIQHPPYGTPLDTP